MTFAERNKPTRLRRWISLARALGCLRQLSSMISHRHLLLQPVVRQRADFHLLYRWFSVPASKYLYLECAPSLRCSTLAYIVQICQSMNCDMTQCWCIILRPGPTCIYTAGANRGIHGVPQRLRIGYASLTCGRHGWLFHRENHCFSLLCPV